MLHFSAKLNLFFHEFTKFIGMDWPDDAKPVEQDHFDKIQAGVAAGGEISAAPDGTPIVVGGTAPVEASAPDPVAVAVPSEVKPEPDPAVTPQQAG